MSIKKNAKKMVDAVRNNNKHLVKVLKVENGVEKIIFERIKQAASPTISFSGTTNNQKTVTYKNGDNVAGTLWYRLGNSGSYTSYPVGVGGTRVVTYTGTAGIPFTVYCYFTAIGKSDSQTINATSQYYKQTIAKWVAISLPLGSSYNLYASSGASMPNSSYLPNPLNHPLGTIGLVVDDTLINYQYYKIE